jgi:hypothetical protein
MKEFVLELDRPRKLVYDFDAWDRIAEKYGAGDEGFDIQSLKVTAKEIPFLIRIGLLWEEPELTDDGVKGLLNAALRGGKYTIIELMNIAVDAICAQAGVERPPLTKSAEIKEEESPPESPTQDSKENAN